MYQPSTNFIGKDPMQWWIGQVTDPDKGEWGDSLEKKQADDGEDIYSFRCRVRIIGYHGCADDLPDNELPLAHVLLPPNTTTTGGCGATLQYQGGEVVVGFFFDGEDGQQPVIFGTLFKQTFIPDDLTTDQFNAKKQTCFTPYTPPKVRQRAGKQRQAPSSPWGGGFSPGELVKTIAAKQKEASTNITIDNFTACEDNEISKISNTIKDFTRKLETLQQLNDQNSYVDPIYGGIIDIQEEIKLTTNKIHNSTTKLVRRARSWLIQDTLDKLNLTLKDKTPKTLQAPVGQATKSLTDVIFCNIEKIQDALLDYLSKSLENMIGQVLDVPVCGIENFLSDMFGQINNILDTNLGNIFGQLNNIQGGGIGLPSSTFSKAIKYANIITNVLDCDALNCPPATSYSSKNGVSKATEDSFDNIINKIGLNSLIDPLLDSLDNAIPAKPSAPNCQTNVLKCGPPRVDFIGSSGQGATGSAIVNALGNVIGVAINGTGFGFEEPPLLSFFDSCDKGYGAGGYPVMGPVSPIANGTNVSVGGVGGTQITANNLPVNAGGQGGIPVTTSSGQSVTADGDLVVAGGTGGIPVTAGGTGGIPITVGEIPVIVNGEGGQGLIAGAFPVVVGSTGTGVGAGGFDGFNITVGGESDLDELYVPDPNGSSLGVVGVVITSPGQEYLSNTTETDIDGNVQEVIPDPNENYDGEQSYLTEVADVVVENTGFGYGDNDTASIGGGSVDSAGNTLPGDANADTIQKPGQAQIELNIQNGLIVGASVVNGGFGFTKLPEITINSDTGAGAKLLPVLKFTKVDDASQLAQTTQTSVITVISCIEK